MKPAKELSAELDDVQAMLASGFSRLASSQFWLLTLVPGEEAAARAWLRKVRKYVESASKVLSTPPSASTFTETVAIAFSFSGLVQLGMVEEADHPFPTPFRTGMGHRLRERLLRDTARNSWIWDDIGDDGRQAVHVLVMQWWDSALPHLPTMTAPRHNDGFKVRVVTGPPHYFSGTKMKEPFGFRDGVSQPMVRGLSERVAKAAGPIPVDPKFVADRMVEPGEFLLGYRNEYDQLSYVPDLVGWSPLASSRKEHRFGFNGSYLAVRQIFQDVGAFRQIDAGCPVVSAYGKPKWSERLMGRYENGAPLSWQGPAHPSSDLEADAFRYRVEDADGFGCPRGAHIRRVNPRDAQGHDVESGIRTSKLHRLLRRGRPYGDPYLGQGIFFIACNADLERQFEFIHQRWIRNPRFAKFEDQDDPILGGSRAFSAAGTPIGESIKLSSFTTTLGGGYFLLPGLRALDFITA
ncbi:Dyp-type peroxidase [Variovorax saccharolyticus]|uniref:Dyp-type peroxidase n=1 Tax=Variovorax saccharolyticus TaxID=3053516 RepID=UPI002575D138|nr:Dyp-type peroxidase domain-containing protein [Variovorax sp. J22R187]MDM0022167.1 Dyp-type peroxidase [Variovorax sp. J22R187]